MSDMRDELLEQVVDELRRLPPVNEAAVGRIVDAVARDEGSAQRAGGMRLAGLRSWWRSRVPLAAAAGFALAAGVGGFLLGDATRGAPVSTSVAASGPAPESAHFVDASRPAVIRPVGSGPQPVQFILDAPRASSVALVGDFNAWDASATPLARDPSSGIWTATVGLPPGRHAYAFMVDGSALTLDPRAPSTHDPDFGTPSSVVLVGTP